MTKKDYIVFAQMIMDERICPPSVYANDPAAMACHEVTLLRLSIRMAKVFKADNPRFDLARFAVACGISPKLMVI